MSRRPLRNSWPQEELDRLLSLIREGMTDGQIGRRMKRTRASVAQRRKALNRAVDTTTPPDATVAPSTESPRISRRLPFRDYVDNRARTFTDIGMFFERVRRDPDFLAIKTRRDMDRYCESKGLKVGECDYMEQIWRHYEKALHRADRATELKP